MKIAGAKNAGAWFRFNKFLKQYRDLNMDAVYDGAAAFYEAHSAAIDAYFAAINEIATDCGYTVPPSPANGSAMAVRWFEIGIPLQVWMGKLSFDTYEDDGMGNIKPKHQTEAFALGKAIRTFCRKWLFASRAYRDLTDTGGLGEGNPGGQPDADPAQ